MKRPGQTTPEQAGAPASPRVHRRRERNRTAMLDAAERMFAAGRFGNLRVEDVAETADVSVGTVYTHFGSKDGLLLAVAQRSLERATDYLAKAYTEGQTPLERMAATGDAYRELLLAHPTIARFLLLDEPLVADPTVTEQIRTSIEALYDAFADVVQTAVDAGDIPPVDARRFARYLIGSWIGVVSLTSSTVGPPFTTEDARACLIDASAVIAAGLTAGA